MIQFLKEKFDILILLLLTSVYVWPSIHGSAYAQRTNDLVLGALLGMLTGKVASSLSKADPPSPPNP